MHTFYFFFTKTKHSPLNPDTPFNIQIPTSWHYIKSRFLIAWLIINIYLPARFRVSQRTHRQARTGFAQPLLTGEYPPVHLSGKHSKPCSVWHHHTGSTHSDAHSGSQCEDASLRKDCNQLSPQSTQTSGLLQTVDKDLFSVSWIEFQGDKKELCLVCSIN